MTMTLTIRNPEDILVVVPTALGFHPAESVVMLTFGGFQSFHARIDMPATQQDIRDAIAALMEPCQRHFVQKVIFVIYTDKGWRRCAKQLLNTFTESHIEVMDVIHTDGSTYAGLKDPDNRVAYDVSNHPKMLEMAVAVGTPKASRDELADIVAPRDVIDPELVKEFDDITATRPIVDMDVDYMAWLVGASIKEDHRLSDIELAGLVSDIQHVRCRDVLLNPMTRENSEQYVEFFSDVVRRTPEEWINAPACLLALSAWLRGDGALAWCALGRVKDKTYPLAGIIEAILTMAVPPSEWAKFREAIN